jgi:hypothetical protein
MPIVVETLEEAGMVEQWRADRRLWLTADKDRVVEDGDPEAAFLYVTPGHIVPRPEAEKLGAVTPRKPAVTEQTPKASSKRSTEKIPDDKTE